MSSKRLGLLAVALILIAAACGGGGYSQDDLDAAVSDAVASALATTSTTSDTVPASTTTTTSAEVTTTEAEGTTTTTVEPTTTTPAVELDDSDPRSADAIVGNEPPPLDRGEDGVISVIASSYEANRFGSTRVFVVARNNTDDQVKGIEIAITVRDDSGGLVSSAETGDMYPYRVAPGGIAFGMAFISDTQLGEGAQFEFQTAASDFSEEYDTNIDLLIVEHGQPGDTVVGILENPATNTVEYNEAAVMCFHEDGALSRFDESYAEADEINPGGTSPVSIDLRDYACPIYLMAATGREQR